MHTFIEAMKFGIPLFVPILGAMAVFVIIYYVVEKHENDV